MSDIHKILIVEDESLNALALGEFLEGLGYSVTGYAARGEEAVRKARETSPDLVFMDVRLSGHMDGLEAARQINKERNVPIILVSGYTEKALEDRVQGFSLFAYLSKPFDFDDVKTLLSNGIS